MFLLRNNSPVKKIVRFDKRAVKELQKFPATIQAKAKAIVEVLVRDGNLIEPYGKKIDHDLFEIRVKHRGQWRLLYAYLINDYIIVLSAFHKKTQKTPLEELHKAQTRLKEYQYDPQT
jgi:phage-related protein